ncbi:hypothetical protein BH10PLA2_BH10PLA2_00230 [soil metagenome]
MAWNTGDGPFSQVAIAYAQGVLDGHIPACNQIKLACKRFEADLDGDDWEFRPALVERVCNFAQLLPHTKSVWAAKKEKIRLEPWQVWILASIFGFVDPATGLRKVRDALCVIPRKNGKSTLAAIIALYMAFLDREAGAEVWIGANSKAQADCCFVPCQDMVSRTPKLREAAGISVQKQSIFSSATGSFIKAMIAKPGDGSNPHCAILDEAHENDSSDQYDTMRTGMGSRLQPLILTITTAGFNVAGPLRQRQVEAEAVLAGNIKNDSLFVAIYTIDPDDDWMDFEVWKKANPCFGVSIHERGMREQYEEALTNPSNRARLLTKHLNVWQNASSGWIDIRNWEACALASNDNQPAPTLSDLRGSTAYIGLDLSSQIDITALVVVVRYPPDPAQREKIEADYVNRATLAEVSEGEQTAVLADLGYFFDIPQGGNWLRIQMFSDVLDWCAAQAIPPARVLVGEWGIVRDNGGFPLVVPPIPGSQGASRADRAAYLADFRSAITLAGFRSSVIHLDTLDYGITMSDDHFIGALDPLLLAAIAPKANLLRWSVN